MPVRHEDCFKNKRTGIWMRRKKRGQGFTKAGCG